jgi:RpiB/LacA/LacB family sugar-phosphate isomerase
MPLVIYTPDVYFQNQLDPETIDPNLDGFILTFKANSPAHSYVKLDKRGLATKTAEKEVISQDAAVGVYYYKTGDMFVKYAERLIHNDITVKNEFYLCPMYNLMIQDGLKIKTKSAEKMHVLGTPSELEFFTNYVVQRFGEKPVALCCDHSGYKLKEAAKKVLDANRVPYIDFGTLMNKNCDYNDYVSQAMQAIESKVCDFAMGFCRTGQGINILANTSKDIRGALVFDEYTAEYCIRHNCANFFTIPEKYVDKDELDRMVKIWLTSSFDGGRHMTRMKKTIG